MGTLTKDSWWTPEDEARRLYVRVSRVLRTERVFQRYLCHVYVLQVYACCVREYEMMATPLREELSACDDGSRASSGVGATVTDCIVVMKMLKIMVVRPSE